MVRSRAHAEIALTESTVVIGGYPLAARRLWLRVGFERSSGLPMLRAGMFAANARIAVPTSGIMWRSARRLDRVDDGCPFSR